MALQKGTANHKVGVDRFSIGPITTNTTTAYVREAMTHLEGITSVGISFQLTESEIKFDDKIEKNASVNAATITATLAKTDIVFLNECLGSYTDSDGICWSGGADQRLDVACGWRCKLKEGGYSYYEFPVCKIGYLEEQFKTAEDADPITVTISSTVMNMPIEDKKRLKREAFDKPASFETEWFGPLTLPKPGP